MPTTAYNINQDDPERAQHAIPTRAARAAAGWLPRAQREQQAAAAAAAQARSRSGACRQAARRPLRQSCGRKAMSDTTEDGRRRPRTISPISKVMAALPHRYPMLLVDRVVALILGERSMRSRRSR